MANSVWRNPLPPSHSREKMFLSTRLHDVISQKTITLFHQNRHLRKFLTFMEPSPSSQKPITEPTLSSSLSISLTSILIWSLCLCQGFPSVLLTYGFTTNTTYLFTGSGMHATCPAQHVLGFLTLTISGIQVHCYYEYYMSHVLLLP